MMILNRIEIEKFYDYIEPVGVHILVEENNEVYAKTSFTKNKADFVNKVLELGKAYDIYACYRKYQGKKRNMFNVTEIKNFAIDIDNDPNQEKAKAFEDFCAKKNIAIDAKVFSGGGYHYYIPYPKTKVTNENRKQIISMSRNFYNLFLENKIDIDSKIFDLARLIRVWGTRNIKRQKDCKIIWERKNTKEAIQYNKELIQSIPTKTQIKPSSDIFVTSCMLIELLRSYKLDKINTQKNDILIKNVAIFLKTNLGAEGYDIGTEITEFQGHKESEFKGWWNKDLSNFSCGEMVNWLKKHYPELLNKACHKCRIRNRNNVIYTDGLETWNQLKTLARPHQRLLINKEINIKGVLNPGFTPHQKEIVVLKIYETTDSETNEVRTLVQFFDEPKPDRALRPQLIREVRIDFYNYMILEDGVEYLLFSERPLEFGEYNIEGSVVRLKDQFLYGDYGKLESKRKIVFVNNAVPMFKKLKSKEELFEKYKHTREETLDYIFTHKTTRLMVLKEPGYFNDLILAFLLSMPDDYPIHLLISGEPGCGKSWILNAIYQKFPETMGIQDSSGATIKGLVPSFYTNPPQIGSLLSCNRIIAIDEFFSMVRKENDENKFTMLNNILEHNEFETSTGKGKIIGKMRAKALAMTNPITGQTFRESIESLPESTISRFFVLNLGPDFTVWVNSGENIVEAKKLNINKYTFLGMYDFLQSFQSEFDRKKLRDIMSELETIVPPFMIDIFRKRYRNHHSLCLIDGIIKSRCLFEKDISFVGKEVDYEKFKELLTKIINDWSGKGITLSESQTAFLELIPNDGIWKYKLKSLCEERHINFERHVESLKYLDKISVDSKKVRKVMQQELNLDDL